MPKKVFDLQELSMAERQSLFGPRDQNLSIIEKIYHSTLIQHGEALYVDPEECAAQVTGTLEQLLCRIRAHEAVDRFTAEKIAEQNQHHGQEAADLYKKAVGRTFEHEPIYARTRNQKILYETLEQKDLTFVTGPAGTGKTYLSVLYAVNCLRAGVVKRIVITRPVVEAGESLGYLPGDLEEKIDPYLRPIYDALDHLLSPAGRQHLLEKGELEIAPLAYMRGRTLEDAVIILDEAQNTTKMQMKMFLTRMGFHSKMIITGDITQIDLLKPSESGLVDALDRLKGIPEIGFMRLDNSDVIRHRLVRQILEKYESAPRE